jgi:predicted transglutaminase-like cysteine proteinase
MLRIFWSLAAFAALVWIPIIIYVFIDNDKSTRRAIIQKETTLVPYWKFGKGSQHRFESYLERESQVEVNSVRDICEWLMGCEYVRDQELFDHPDLWQHPVDFEASRQGDCEDHSLWTWRKLHDLGIEAEFVVGKIRHLNGSWGDHSWVALTNGSDAHILETTAKKMDRFFVNASRADSEYRPVYGIDTKLRSFAYEQLKTK